MCPPLHMVWEEGDRLHQQLQQRMEDRSRQLRVGYPDGDLTCTSKVRLTTCIDGLDTAAFNPRMGGLGHSDADRCAED